VIHNFEIDQHEFEAFISDKAMELQLKRVSDKEAQISSQEQSLKRLLVSASKGNTEAKFLALYDASMRNLEIILLNNSFLISKTPHLVLKKVVGILDPKLEIVHLVTRRHQIKKNKFNAKPVDFAIVEELLDLLSGKITTWYQ